MSAKRLPFLTIWQKPSQHHQQMHPETVDGKKQPHTSSLAYLNQKQVLSETFEVNLSRWSSYIEISCVLHRLHYAAANPTFIDRKDVWSSSLASALSRKRWNGTKERPTGVKHRGLRECCLPGTYYKLRPGSCGRIQVMHSKGFSAAIRSNLNVPKRNRSNHVMQSP